MGKFFAIANEHVGTCKAVNWARNGIEPMILAEGDDPAAVSARAEELRGTEITVFDAATNEPSRWWE